MGNENNLDFNFKYNYDSQVSLTITLSKICYSKGETVSGTMFLKTKPYLQETVLFNPQASISLVEYRNSGDPEANFNIYYGGQSTKINSKDQKTYFTYPLDLAAYHGANLFVGINIDFFVLLPTECKSSCIIDDNTYIKHFIVIDFPSIRAKKSEPIIIKNNKYYTLENKLYQSPIIAKLETSKHKYAIFNKGEIKASLTLPKNSFKYNENIYFIMEIDCSKLSISISGVRLSINVNLKSNLTPGDKNDNNSKSIEIITKKLEFKKSKKKYYIDDFIKLPDNSYNPDSLYKKYDQLKKLKFNDENILYQPCYEENLNCQYSIKAMIEINSWFSTNEFIEIPIDLYADADSNSENKIQIPKTTEEDELPSLEDIIKDSNKNIELNENNDNYENKNEIINNGYYNINYVDNNTNYSNNNINDKENIKNNDDNGNEDAPPSSGQFL